MPTKKKIILFLPLFSVFLALPFSLWLNKSVLDNLNKNLGQRLNNASRALAQEAYPFYFFPRFPQRLIYVLSEANMLIDELVDLNEGLNNQLKESDCKFSLSECLPKITFGGVGCQPARVLGPPYKNVKEIEEKKEEIADRIDNLSFLKELLKKEMESGLPKELETLREEVAEELKSNLENVLEESEEIIRVAKENQDLYNKDYTKNCVASCQPGPVCGFNACFMLFSGAQKNINIKAALSIGLDDLDLGKVEIDKFNLALPDKIQFPELGDITFTLPPQTLSVCFPLKPITVSADPPSLKTLPSPSFSCPRLPWDLKLPELPIPKLPKEFKIKIPFLEIPVKCPDIPDIPGQAELEKIRQELMAAAEQEIGVFKNKIDEAINQVNRMIQEATDEAVKEELEKLKKDLQEEYEKVKEEIPKEAEIPASEFKTPGASAEYQYQTPESKGLELEDISLSYQCSQTEGGKQVEVRPGNVWYSETLSWLMEKCANLPTMTSALGLKTKAVNCYDKDKVVKTITDECAKLWKDYCSVNIFGIPLGPEPPEICKKIRYSCEADGNRAAAAQCQNLFSQEKLSVPAECRSEPVLTLKNKCQELKEKYPKEPPEPCKVLPLFTGKIEEPGPETHSGKATSCPAQKLLNLPFGFGGGIGFNCPVGLPSAPKIVLPDIIIPDIILPDFRIPPFLRVKLPSLIIEDLILPDVELCDLNNCANVFPPLFFKLLRLTLPGFDVSAPLPDLPGGELRTRIEAREINFSLPQINLFNLLLPELELPEIPIPSPKVNFRILGIDVRAIFDLIFTYILNALDVPDFGYCLTFKISTTFLSIVYPDYYFSFCQPEKTEKLFGEGAAKALAKLCSLEAPKIPYCKDVNKFCGKVKNALGEGGWLKKAQEIEAVFNKTIDTIQKEVLDKVSEATEKAQDAIDEVFGEVYGRLISEAVAEQLAKRGLSLEDYTRPGTREIDLTKVPFPGVFPVKVADKEGREIGECLPVSTPQVDIILRIVDKREYPEIKIEKNLWPPPIYFIIYVPVDMRAEFPIPWPEELKKILLVDCNQSGCDQCVDKGKSFCQEGCQAKHSGECNIDYLECAVGCYEMYKDAVCEKECGRCLSYELPPIPLSCLNYEKEFDIKGPGFQPRTFYFDFGTVNEGDCLAEEPGGGNPFPIGQITIKIDEIKGIQRTIDSSSQKIIRILE